LIQRTYVYIGDADFEGGKTIGAAVFAKPCPRLPQRFHK
jgi:hypothetical protein